MITPAGPAAGAPGSSPRVTVAIDGDGIAQVRLARPDKLNALDEPMIAALLDLGAALARDGGLRAVVLAGEGKAFCAGLDLAVLAGGTLAGPPLAERTHGAANRFQQLALQWRQLPCPVIAAIHGACLGGGLQIAAGADIRVVAPDARLSVMELRWGIVPDMGHFALWRGLVRDDVLRELTYTQREVGGEEAVRLGLATHVDPDPVARATGIARAIAARSPAAVRAAKALANGAAEWPVGEILLAESRAQQALLGSPDQREAVLAQMERRPGRFIG